MKATHLILLESVFRKFVVLTQSQAFSLLAGRLKRRGIYYCIEQLISENKIVPAIGLVRGSTLYIARRELLTALPNQGLLARQSCSPWHIEHRLACGDVAFALAAREFVTGIALEHESVAAKFESPIIGRQSDLLVQVQRPERPPMTVAIEVETTLRTRERIGEVISAYANTFEKYPHRVAGVLVVCGHPKITRAYREMLDQAPKKFPDRFLLTEDIALKDVQETILGRALPHSTNNPSQPLQKLCIECNEGRLNFDLAVSTRTQGTQSGFETRRQPTGVLL